MVQETNQDSRIIIKHTPKRGIESLLVHQKRSKSIMIGGGARSGKSSFAQNLAESLPGRRAYLATAEAKDQEMEFRIARHQAMRGKAWAATIEEPLELGPCLERLRKDYDIIMVDCITLWLANHMAQDEDDSQILTATDEIALTLKDPGGTIIVVTNEVGLGLVPEFPLGRRFRDLAGLVNQRLAQACMEVYFTLWGLPQKLK
ncbi:MAG TPA: bifunctional adenosylcobinamide kinase/adenosylcobinamide-phosphate guanylyltransferase [Proteobacteria bacterium]|nr:bifunctional adenosylcobinamide kinase/adenosylcobinamide-phosphate guanylyltransferase [Pseudomonadota bacterium]